MAVESLFFTDDILPFLYLLICTVGVAHFQMTTSLSLTTVVMSLSEFTHNVIREPLWSLTPVLGLDLFRILWAGTWVSLNLITALTIYKLHVWKNTALTRTTYVTICSLALLNVAHTIRYLSAISIKSTFIKSSYELAIPIINFSLVAFLLFTLFRDIYDIRIQARVRRLPR